MTEESIRYCWGSSRVDTGHTCSSRGSDRPIGESIISSYFQCHNRIVCGIGWTLQERYLSRRTLHYTKYQMFWECNKGVFEERGDHSPRLCSLESVLCGDRFIEPPWFQAWLKLVEKYSYRRLTVATDRLPALSGIASRLGEATGDQYCAGIWQSRILQGMPWQKSRIPTSTTNYNSESRLQGPTWSWASISYPVLFHPRVISNEVSTYERAICGSCNGIESFY